MRQKLTPAFVTEATATPGAGRTTYWDEGLPGFGLMVTRNGHRSYVVQYRAGGRSRRMHLKNGLTLTAARKEARAILGDVARNRDPLGERRKAERAESSTVKAIVEEYLTREGKRLRSINERRATLQRHVLPRLGARLIGDITRTDIVRLLDRVADTAGAPMADHVLAHLRRVMSWHASRSDDFRSPIVRGMARTSPSQRRRQRILTDAELRAVWQAAEAPETAFGYLVQFLILTAARRNEAASMQRSEVSGDEWTIPQERYKTGLELVVPLSSAAQAILTAVPKIGKSGLVFTTDGKHPLSGFSKFKRAFDDKVLAKLREHDLDATLPRWTLHDLRRTARSLMSRAGVPSDHAERCLGHVIGGVRGVYDRHQYLPEKRRAFEALAALVERILNPPADNVVLLARAEP
ncbi:tyrosine-type recombinase/integrase [Bradyrhizobium diazoefficiens]|uniref:tyrosine-type recombinase/integrase n=1 Tax=Bradyrhizobium diazoefficiens TaxID=1355477 RepID=UPI00190E17BC|nr:site-specific integrase [Bradyrhizobium diazoefficiens]QQO34501.1 tyrosine-type recombinase/integrase [Bradyrhizobium diazoefficiens]